MGYLFRYKKSFILIACLLLFLAGHAQLTIVTGNITDSENGAPIPFANVYFSGTTIGATTDVNGNFLIETRSPEDSLAVTYVGYLPVKKAIAKGMRQVINFELTPDQVTLNEVVVVPEEELIDLMFNWIINNKDANNSEKHDAYQCEAYNRIQVDVNNVNDKMKERRAFRKFQFVFDYVDTLEMNGKVYLPVLISEAVSEIFFRKEPRTKQEIIKASRISGFQNESMAQHVGSMYQDVNIYDNYIYLFEKNFVGPIANFGRTYYKYTITDTVFLDDHLCFEIDFEPRRRQELTFQGTMWINDTSFAVKKVNMVIAEDANLNFVSDLVLEMDYDKVDGEHWMVSKEFVMFDVNPIENSKRALGFFLRRTSTFRDYVFNRKLEPEFYSAAVNIEVDNEAMERDEAYWVNRRHEDLSDQEHNIFAMVDSVKKVPAFNTYVDFIYMLSSGYIKAGKFEFGPIYKLMSFNDIEGVRLRVGGRTSTKFSKKVRLSGHLAYGFKDQVFKYGIGGLYMFNTNPRRLIGANYKYDMEQLGSSAETLTEDNFFASLFRITPADKLTMVRQYDGYYEHEWLNGFSTTFKFLHREVYPLGDTRFTIYEGEDIQEMSSIVSSEPQILMRFAFSEKYVYGDFNRVSLGTRYPVIQVAYGFGIPNFLGSDFGYHKLQFRIKHWFNVFSLGWSKYIFEAGKIWGTLPYPLLKIHEGNQSFIFYETVFNLMNYYEYISDQYASIYYTHHFDGLILNHIPLMRKLKWRTVIHGRAVIGSLSEKNKSYSEFPENSGTLEKPYAEAGVGIENIFKIIRIDAIWRLTNLEHADAARFRVFFTLQFNF